MSPLPPGVWQHLATDFHGPLPDGHYFLVIIDEYSRYPIVKIVKSTAARYVIPVLSEVFSLFGIPTQVKTDNGPPFQGNEFQSFLSHMGVKHRKITPFWPRANGMVERFMRNLNRVLRNCKVNGKYWKEELDVFLRNYRNTPHETTGVSPASLVFKTSSISTRLPHVVINHQQEGLEDQVSVRDAKNKLRMKAYFDRKHKTQEHHFQVGDEVLVSVNPSVFNKSSPKRDS